MRVLFVNCIDFLESTLPEGIALLSSILKGRGHEVEVFDTAFLKPKNYELNAKKTKYEKMAVGISFYKKTTYDLTDLTAGEPEVDIADRFFETVERFKPSLIAISAMTTNYEKSMDLIRGKKLPCKVILGGMHSTLMPESVIKEKEVDFVCIGEGDETLLELCESLENGRDVSGIKNLVVKTGSGVSQKVVENRLRPFMNLDLLPVLDLSVFDPRHFFRPFLGNLYKGIFMSTSRGCPRGCAYCVNNRLRNLYKECGSNYLRFQSPKTIARNISALKEQYGITWFKFSDDTFLMRPIEYIYELKDLLKPLNIMFGCSVDPATVTEEKIRLAKEMGCVAMSVGIETGNEEIRRQILKRYISNQQMKEALRMMRDYDIKLSTFNMIGLPGETRENVYETIRLNKELEVPNANVYILYPFPGTRIYDDFNISLDSYKHIPFGEDAHIFNLSKMTKEDLLFFQRAFNLFLVLPENYWNEIEQSKRDRRLYEKLVGVAQDIIDNKAVSDYVG
jgi:anaerobic magnesium-protoporphyrin IX monomethyl ester cyclase